MVLTFTLLCRRRDQGSPDGLFFPVRTTCKRTGGSHRIMMGDHPHTILWAMSLLLWQPPGEEGNEHSQDISQSQRHQFEHSPVKHVGGDSATQGPTSALEYCYTIDLSTTALSPNRSSTTDSHTYTVSYRSCLLCATSSDAASPIRSNSPVV